MNQEVKTDPNTLKNQAKISSKSTNLITDSNLNLYHSQRLGLRA